MKMKRLEKERINAWNLDTLIRHWKMLILMHGLPAPKLVVLLDLGLTRPQQSVLSQLICTKDNKLNHCRDKKTVPVQRLTVTNAHLWSNIIYSSPCPSPSSWEEDKQMGSSALPGEISEG